MKKSILTNKAGVTILEGVVALGLLALVAGGAFGVLLSASRQNTQPDIREEMAWAVEKAHDKLKAYIGQELLPTNTMTTASASGLCGGETNPLQEGETYVIKCMLPPICDANNSEFTYEVEGKTLDSPSDEEGEEISLYGYDITFFIRCNGYKL